MAIASKTNDFTPREERVYDALGIVERVQFMHRGEEHRAQVIEAFEREHGVVMPVEAQPAEGCVDEVFNRAREEGRLDEYWRDVLAEFDDLTLARDVLAGIAEDVKRQAAQQQSDAAPVVAPVAASENRAGNSPPVQTPTFAITVIDSDDTLSKTFTLKGDELVKGSAANLTKGTATRHDLQSLLDLIETFDSLTAKHAITFGVFDYPECAVRTDANVKARSSRVTPDGPPVVARTKEHMHWPDGPGVMMLDNDPLPGATALPPDELIGAVQALADVTILWRPSSSSYVRVAATQECRGLRGQHLYFVVKDAKRIKEVGDILFDRLWLAGHGGILIGRDGVMHAKTLVDRMVWQQERLDFIRADCGPGVEQHSMQARIFPGGNDYIDGETWLDPDDVVPLTADEQATVARLQHEAKAAKQGEADAVRAAWKKAQGDKAEKKAEAQGLTFDRQAFEETLGGGVLPLDFVLYPHEGGAVTVREVKANPAKFRAFADPHEPEYGGNDTRIAILTPSGRIVSHAHGKREYVLGTLEERHAEVTAAFDDPYSLKEDFTERGNANLLARLTAGDLRFIAESKVWLAWRNQRWEVDPTGAQANMAADLVAKHYADEVARLSKQLDGMDRDAAKRHQKTIDTVAAWEKACRSRRGIDNMIALASKLPDIAISETALDTNLHLLGVQNGVVDLRTGELRPDAREDLVTQRCAFAYNKHAPGTRWRSFVEEVTGAPIAAHLDDDGNVVAGTVGRFTPRPAFAEFVQRAVGYSATGVTREHKMFVPFGEQGSNGKNVFADAISNALGASYGVTTSPKLLLAGRHEVGDAHSATPAFVKLKGSRFAVGSEPPAGSSFDASVLKALTGNATLSARALRCDEASFTITFHLWLLCNAKPRLQNLESAVAGRLLMLPFDRQWNRPATADYNPLVPDADPTLAEALAADGEGVLSWIVEGAVRYFAEGLKPCAEVIEASRSYIASQRVDPVAKWLDEETEVCAPSMGATATDLFNAFTTWRTAREAAGSLRAGDSPLTAAAFGLALKKRGVEKTKTNAAMRLGLRLRSEFDQ